jgi:hypothetical protein
MRYAVLQKVPGFGQPFPAPPFPTETSTLTRPGSEEWNHLKFCVEQHHLHVQTEVRRDPKKTPAKFQLDKADALARKFHPNFS